jgi:hypothetical protein
VEILRRALRKLADSDTGEQPGPELSSQAKQRIRHALEKQNSDSSG